MKNMFKHGALYAALFMLAFAGCSSSMDMTPQIETGLKITIKSDIDAARTLYPSQPFFSKYVLELTGDWEDKEVTLTSATTTIPLSAGEWYIKVTGFTTFSSVEYAVAEGTGRFTVTDGVEDVNVDIRAIQDASQDGFLFFNVSYPEAAVSKAELYIYNVGSSYNESRYHWELGKDDYDKDEKLYHWKLDYINPISTIAPGYHMMTLMLDVKDSRGNYYRTVSWTEVIHIYSGMETRAEKTFTLDDLNRFITLGGAVNVTVNGNVPDQVYVRLFRNQNYTDLYGVSSGTTSWQISIPATTSVFYIQAEASYNGISFFRNFGSINVTGNDITAPINYAFSNTLTVSGTADVRINNVRVPEVWVIVYNASDTEIARTLVAANNNWQMLLDSNYSGTTVNFRVNARDPASGYNLLKDTGISRTLSSQNTGISIVLNTNTIKLSGIANITVNGSAPSYASVEVYRNNNTTWVASCAVQADKTWEISLPIDLIGSTVTIRIEGYTANGNEFTRNVRQTYVVPNSDATIDFTGAI